jgi:hypothetical protein
MNNGRRLELVDVPRPCSISWESMTGTDKARACAVCGRQVHDLWALTTSEAERLLDRRDERLCIRSSRGPDGKIITADRLPKYSPQKRSFAGPPLPHLPRSSAPRNRVSLPRQRVRRDRAMAARRPPRGRRSRMRAMGISPASSTTKAGRSSFRTRRCGRSAKGPVRSSARSRERTGDSVDFCLPRRAAPPLNPVSEEITAFMEVLTAAFRALKSLFGG